MLQIPNTIIKPIYIIVDKFNGKGIYVTNWKENSDIKTKSFIVLWLFAPHNIGLLCISKKTIKVPFYFPDSLYPLYTLSHV